MITPIKAQGIGFHGDENSNTYEEVLELLKLVSSMPKAKAEIDSFLKKRFTLYNKDCKGFDDCKRKEYLSGVIKDYKDLADSLLIKYGLNTDASMAYFEMDSNLFKKIKQYNYYYLNHEIVFYVRENNLSMHYSGGSFSNLYRNTTQFIVDYFILNKSFFPKSTDKLITKQVELENQVSFDYLDNSFKAKAFLNQFGSEFKIGEFEKILKIFGDISDNKLRFDTYYNLFNAIYFKYISKGRDNEQVYEFLDSLAVRALHHSSSEFHYICADLEYFSYLEKIVDDNIFCSALARAAYRRKSERQLPMVMSFLVDGHELELMHELLSKQFASESKDNFFKFDLLPNDMIELYFIESKKQFLKNNKNLYELLKKIGRLPDFVDF